MTKKKSIIGWSLHVEWDNGKTENIIDLEEFMSSSQIQGIDDSLRELEESESEWDKTLESIGIDPNKPLTLEDQEEESK